ncbi:hypothetical protein BT93_L5608 [Corymbia citriodora subsp. variegata]|uniref:RNase H type-1 domain-containing protein n=1 Tax=Corymbia citriodora subsp. variegata TaxID=360336 RepID=A0A8T0CRX9_CORYI|nr:hypothetical protein BT93_L5608 [Corymbia citriodora subsp. variegata]
MPSRQRIICITEFASTLWAIWKQRNSWVFRGKQPQPKDAINEAEQAHQIFTRWSTIAGSKSGNSDPTMVNWTLPEQGALKINLDAAWSSSRMEGSAAVLCRNSQGYLTDGFAGKIRAPSAHLAETLTLRSALQWINERRKVQLSSKSELIAATPKVILTSDCKAAVSHVFGMENVPWAARSVVEDCRWLLAQLDNVHLIYEPRSTNRAADWVAKTHIAGALTPNWVYFMS